MSADRPTMIASIVRATSLTINTSRFLEHGAYNVIVEVNDEWVFRFPRPGSPRDHEQDRLIFLEGFAKVSPLSVPDPIYVTDDFVGYRKIVGSHLYPTQMFRRRRLTHDTDRLWGPQKSFGRIIHVRKCLWRAGFRLSKIALVRLGV